MKILVLSDTHGDISMAKKIWASLDDLDLVLHLGDYYEDAEKLAAYVRTRVIAVHGNMDFEGDSPLHRIIDTEYGPVLITHGHCDRVRASYDKLLYRAEEAGCKAALFGHTHVAVNEVIDGIHVVNPGSLTRPRDGAAGSYAVIETSEDRFDCRIIRTDSSSEKNGGKNSKAKAGMLRSILNYSDRL